MNIKYKAYELKKAGMSYGQIAKQLQIGRTTAYDYIREVKSGVARSHHSPSVPNSSEPASEQGLTLGVTSHIMPQTELVLLKAEKKKVKEFTGDELIEKHFDSLDFDGKFLELIGKPSRIFSGIIWGLPKGGKSNFSIRFADYLQEYFGDVVYVAAEEGESVTLQEKIKAIGGSKVTFAENRDRESIREYLQDKACDFVFIDSINNAGIDNEFLEMIKQENPNKSFISIVQATKGGNFKGDQALTHNCDFIIKVVAGVASHFGRFNTASEINIFDEPLYEKNPIDRKRARKGRSKQEVPEELEGVETEKELNQDLNLVQETPQALKPNIFANLSITKEELDKVMAQMAAKRQARKLEQLAYAASLPSKPISGKTWLWILGIASTLSLIDNVLKKNKEQVNKTTI